MINQSLINLINPKSNSTIMIYDVHASESGALAILDDLYNQIKVYKDKTVKWIFIVSIPNYKETKNIVVKRFPWVKKNWGYRYYFDNVTTRKLLHKFKPDQVFSLQNKGISFYHNRQLVYLHLPFILTDHKFNIRVDGKKLWLYQNVVSKYIFRSLRKVDMTIVQTQWMKTALIEKAGIKTDKVIIQQPDIRGNSIGAFEDIEANRRRFFYPATAFTYKNHMTALKAIKYAQDKGLSDYEVIFTIQPNENDYTKQLFEYSQKNNLNVQFSGPISRKEVFKMYTKSILLFPSYVESFGLPLLEARMSASPVIASDTPFSHEILDGYQKVIFCGEQDYKAIGEAILKQSLLNNMTPF